MSQTLRLLLVFFALIAVVWIFGKIRKLKVKIEDSIFWIFFAGVLCVLAIFPELSYWLTGLLGFISPANLVFLLIIVLMLEKLFTLSIIVSQLEEKVTVLSAELAIRTHKLQKIQIELADSENTNKEAETEKKLD